MSLFGALRTGVSGLSAQSSAMSIISDNIANVNTIGYKANSASFSTLVTKQVSSTRYSSGGVYCRTRAGVDIQGLLSSTTYSTDLGISGNGFFVTTQTSQPSVEDLWSYTRVGNFSVDQDGYLKNDNGFYLQAWPLQAYDGYENASLVQIGPNMYMKAYTDEKGTTVYVNDNIIDANNLRAINLNTIGGTAQETHNVSFGANLPADDPVFDPAFPEKGGRHSSSVLIYDSLGNSHNATLTFTKTNTGTWSLDIGMPSGAATMVTYSSIEGTADKDPDVYSARAQLEFNSIPTNHSYIAMETNGTNYVFEFTEDNTTSYSPKANEVVVAVDLSSGIVTTADAVDKFNNAIQNTLPSAGRFYVGTDGTTIEINQSTSGSAVKFKVNSTACAQSAANPDPSTGISTGEFELPEIDWNIKNTARIDFASDNLADYLDKSITIGNNTYIFRDAAPSAANGVITVDIRDMINYTTGKIDTVKLVSLLKQSINNNEPDYERYVASGSTLEINPTSTGSNILVSSGNSASVTFQSTNVAAYVGQFVTIGDIAGGGAKTYEFTDNPGLPSGTVLAGGNIAVNISDIVEKDHTSAVPIAVMSALYNTMTAYYENANNVTDLSNYIQVNGATMVSTGVYLDADRPNVSVELNQDTLTFASTDINDYDGTTVSINGTAYTLARGISNSTTLDLDTIIGTETLTFTGVPLANENVVVNGTTYTFVDETETLTFTGVPTNGQTVVVGANTYTFIRETSTLNLNAVPAAGETVTINGTLFTFVAGPAGANEVSLNTPTAITTEAQAADALAAAATAAGIDISVDGASLTVDYSATAFASTLGTAPTITNRQAVPGDNELAINGLANAADAMDALKGALGETPDGSTSLTLARNSFHGGTCTVMNQVNNYAGANEVGLTGIATAADAMAALGDVARVPGSVVGATLTLGGDNLGEGTCTVTTLDISVSPETVMTNLATLANVSEYQLGDKLVMTAYNTHAITSADFVVTPDTVNEDVQTFVQTNGIGNDALNVAGKDNGQQCDEPDTDGLLVLTNAFSFNNVDNAQSGSLIPAVSFNADGTPKQIGTDKVAIEWANGASDMTGNYYESSQLNLYIGDVNTANGLTQLAGKFTTNYVNQDGAKFGNYTGVSVSEDGIVTAIFDNGETRAIAQIPLATFVDVNSLEALTGNAYIETTTSGNASLCTAGQSGAGVIASSSLEQSTVDIAEEFTDMITTQRAYSAASRIITTADSMLEELLTIKR